MTKTVEKHTEPSDRTVTSFDIGKKFRLPGLAPTDKRPPSDAAPRDPRTKGGGFLAWIIDFLSGASSGVRGVGPRGGQLSEIERAVRETEQIILQLDEARTRREVDQAVERLKQLQRRLAALKRIE